MSFKPCEVKQRLLAELEAANAEAARLYNEEIGTAAGGEWKTEARMRIQVEVARRRREEAVLAVRKHIAEHRC